MDGVAQHHHEQGGQKNDPGKIHKNKRCHGYTFLPLPAHGLDKKTTIGRQIDCP